MPPTHSAELVDADAVADHFGVSIEAVRRWARTGLIPSFRANQRIVRFRLSEVEAALRQAIRIDGSEKAVPTR